MSESDIDTKGIKERVIDWAMENPKKAVIAAGLAGGALGAGASTATAGGVGAIAGGKGKRWKGAKASMKQGWKHPTSTWADVATAGKRGKTHSPNWSTRFGGKPKDKK